MDALVCLNACNGPGLRRFQENLVFFSKGKQAILLPGSPPPVAPTAQPPGVLKAPLTNLLCEERLKEIIASRKRQVLIDEKLDRHQREAHLRAVS